MKVSSWQGVIISWANALRLLDEPVSDVLDLVKGSFFVKLLNKTKCVDNVLLPEVSEDDVYRVIDNFLKEEFSNFRLLGYWDNDEVTLVASVILLWSSLESQSLRTPLFQLDNTLQLKIQAFIQSFIETPRHLVNRQLVTDAVLEIMSDGETDDEGCSFVSSSPRTYSTPKRPSFNSSYSPAMLALSEMRSLRNKVDLLNCEKQHLQEELEVTKSQLSVMSKRLEEKEADLNKLRNMFMDDEEEKASNRENSSCCKSGNESSKCPCCEVSLYKEELEELRDELEKIRQDLESTLQENTNIAEKLKKEQALHGEAQRKCINLEEKTSYMGSRVEELENLVASLKKTCEEQSVILAERIKPVEDESFQIRDCESLGGLIDKQYSELQDELQTQKELLEEKSKMVAELLEYKSNAEKSMQDFKKEIDTLKSQLSLSKDENFVDCRECSVLRDNYSSLQIDYCSKSDEYSKLKEELNRKNNQIKLLLNSKAFDESRIAELRDKINILINDYDIKCEDLKEEIVALKCELCESNNTLGFFKDETSFLSNCLEDKKSELKCLESDYTKINLSKDREIAQLMTTVDHLNKELRKLQDQLHGEVSKNEQLCHSAYQWRQKLSHGNTANEELARELITLHESLEFKTLKLADLSGQIEQMKNVMADKEALNKELHERLIFISDKNKELNREVNCSRNTIAHLQSRVSSLEFNEKRLNHEIVKKIKKFEVADSELKELRKVLREKFLKIDFELDTCIFRGNPNLQEIIEFTDFIREKLKENKTNINHLTIIINELEAENSEKCAELDMYMKKIDELAVVKGRSSLEFQKQETSVFQDKLKKIESDYENNMIKLQDTLEKLEQANISLETKNTMISNLESEVNNLKQELKTKTDFIECLQQNVNLYEHEKHVLERRLSNLSSLNSDKTESRLDEKIPFWCTQSNEKMQQPDGQSISSVEQQADFEVRLQNAVEEKVTELQQKMREEFAEELKSALEEHSKKIEQLKGKVKKDCLHIERLSSDLWETSDRLLLAQQESDALRSQLRKTKNLLAEQQVSNRGVLDSHSFMWLGNGTESGNYVDEFVSITTKRTFQSGKFSSDLNVHDFGNVDDEEFNEQCLEDLKAGICRLPSPIRLSCPAESTRRDDDSELCMPPPGKPRKLKGSITYRKPGPPTPSIHAARHSLPGNEKLELRRGLREHNGNVTAKSRLSQLFGSIHITKPKCVVQESPKVKRKGFFQRTFGNRENMPPKT